MTDAGQDRELLLEFRNESLDLLSDTEQALTALQNNLNDLTPVNAVFRALHTIKGNSSFFGLNRIKDYTHGVETYLDRVRNGKLALSRELVATLVEARDHLLQMIESIDQLDRVAASRDQELLLSLQQHAAATPTDLMGMVADLLRQVSRDLPADLPDTSIRRLIDRAMALVDQPIKELDPRPAEKRAETETKDAVANTQVANNRRFMRVDEAKIDRFLADVGELLNLAEIFASLQRRIDSGEETAAVSRDFKLANRSLHEVSDDLQAEVMEIRQVPLQAMFGKLARIVRETGKQLGKQVDVELSGESLLIDKSYAEMVEGPLVHVIRNAIDHGVELPQVREAGGKPASGKVRIQFSVHKDCYEFVVADDGKGMDPELLKRKAVEKGLLRPSDVAHMSHDEAFQIVCLPGFSTAATVTEVSGRGVGMDVVQTSLTRVGGTIRIESEKDKGSRFLLRLPRSLALIVVSGLMVEVAEACYIVPMESLREAIPILTGAITRLPSGDELITVRGRPMPFLRLAQLLGLPAPSGGTQAIVVQFKQREAALEVTRAMGLQKVVVKRMDEHLSQSRFVRGGAILGDGQVGLVLDVGTLFSAAP